MWTPNSAISPLHMLVCPCFIVCLTEIAALLRSLLDGEQLPGQPDRRKHKGRKQDTRSSTLDVGKHQKESYPPVGFHLLFTTL